METNMNCKTHAVIAGVLLLQLASVAVLCAADKPTKASEPFRVGEGGRGQSLKAALPRRRRPASN